MNNNTIWSGKSRYGFMVRVMHHSGLYLMERTMGNADEFYIIGIYDNDVEAIRAAEFVAR